MLFRENFLKFALESELLHPISEPLVLTHHIVLKPSEIFLTFLPSAETTVAEGKKGIFGSQNFINRLGCR